MAWRCCGQRHRFTCSTPSRTVPDRGPFQPIKGNVNVYEFVALSPTRDLQLRAIFIVIVLVAMFIVAVFMATAGATRRRMKIKRELSHLTGGTGTLSGGDAKVVDDSWWEEKETAEPRRRRTTTAPKQPAAILPPPKPAQPAGAPSQYPPPFNPPPPISGQGIGAPPPPATPPPTQEG